MKFKVGDAIAIEKDGKFFNFIISNIDDENFVEMYPELGDMRVLDMPVYAHASDLIDLKAVIDRDVNLNWFKKVHPDNAPNDVKHYDWFYMLTYQRLLDMINIREDI